MTHSDIIDLWPSLTEFSLDMGIAYGTAKAMRRRGSIPSIYWKLLERKAAIRKIAGVTLDAFAAAVDIEAVQ